MQWDFVSPGQWRIFGFGWAVLSGYSLFITFGWFIIIKNHRL